MSAIENTPEQFEDESVYERIVALQEMFPQPVVTAASTVINTTTWTAYNVFKYGGKLAWILASSALVLALIPQYEADQEQIAVQQQESMRMQHQQMLTGGSPHGMGPVVPGMAPPPQRQ
eukprot:m.78851 g.78851  ORF g.78851 m.78851 type:complete len:119 (-) comp14130_c0_seq2:420-776(-)